MVTFIVWVVGIGLAVGLVVLSFWLLRWAVWNVLAAWEHRDLIRRLRGH